MSPTALADLVQAWCEEGLGPDDRVVLIEHLRNDPGFAAAFHDQLALHHRLMAHYRAPGTDEVLRRLQVIDRGNRHHTARHVVDEIRSRRLRQRRLRSFGILAAAGLIFGVGLWCWRILDAGWSAPVPPPVAIGAGSDVLPASAAWDLEPTTASTVVVGGDGVRRQGINRLACGEELIVGAGTVVLTCDERHRLTLRGPARLRWQGAEGFDLSQGSVEASVEPLHAGRSFAIATRTLRARVIGTRFTIVDDGIRSLLSVAQGTVAMRIGDAGPEEAISAGSTREVIRVDPAYGLPAGPGSVPCAAQAYAAGGFCIPAIGGTEGRVPQLLSVAEVLRTSAVDAGMDITVRDGVLAITAAASGNGSAVLHLPVIDAPAFSIAFDLRLSGETALERGYSINLELAPLPAGLAKVERRFNFTRGGSTRRWVRHDLRFLLVGRDQDGRPLWEFCQVVEGHVYGRTLVRAASTVLRLTVGCDLELQGIALTGCDPGAWFALGGSDPR